MSRKLIHKDTGREILPLNLSVYHAARDCKVGIAGIAGAHGWNIGTFGNKLAPTQPGHKLLMEEFEAVLDVTHDPRILDSICHSVGAVWNWADEVKACPSDMDVLATGQNLNRASFEMLETFIRAIDDGEVDDEEAAEIEKAAYGVIKALESVRGTAKRFRSVS